MKKSGFTLLELLISMTLFSAIAGLLMSSFFNFQGIGHKLETKLKARQELRNLQTLLTEDLSNLVYLKKYASASVQGRPSGIKGTDNPVGGLQEDRVDLQIHSRGRFFTSFKRSLNPELFEVSYYFARDDKGVKGFYRRESYYIAGPIETGGSQIIHRLSTRLSEMDLVYYDRKGKLKKKWVSTQKAPLPTGIKVKLSLKSDSGELFHQTFTINIHPSMGPGVTWGQP